MRKTLTLEPFDGFEVSYLLRYPPPVGEQVYRFLLERFRSLRAGDRPGPDLRLHAGPEDAQRAGPGLRRPPGQLHPGRARTTSSTPTFAFPDEFARHKILDIIGDLYLLGYPIRGRVRAELTGHRDNINVLREILASRLTTPAESIHTQAPGHLQVTRPFRRGAEYRGSRWSAGPRPPALASGISQDDGLGDD